MQSPALKVFKIRGNKALNNLVSGECWPCFELEVGLETSCGAFQPNGYRNSVFVKNTWLCNHLYPYAHTHLVFLFKNTEAFRDCTLSTDIYCQI